MVCIKRVSFNTISRLTAYSVDIIRAPIIAVKLSYNGFYDMRLIYILLTLTVEAFAVNFLLA